MSDVKRYNCRIPADSLLGANLYQQVVLASDYDALAQRCRELEAERNHFAIQAQRFYNERDTLRAEIDEARRTAGFWKDEHLAGNRVIDQLRAEVTSLHTALTMHDRIEQDTHDEVERLRAENRALKAGQEKAPE